MEVTDKFQNLSALPPPPGKRDPRTPWIGSCVGHRDGLDAVVKRKDAFPVPARDRTPVVQLSRYTDWSTRTCSNQNMPRA